MAVYLGDSGCIELRRTSLDEVVLSEIVPSDVNHESNRFSFDYPTGQYITGDMIEITTTNGANLDFIDPEGWGGEGPYDDGKFFIYVDQVGGISLYRDFCDAVGGEIAQRVPLNPITETIPIQVTVEDNFTRILAQVTDYEINTEREAVDVTELGENFRQQYSTLISGSGRLSCFFDYESRDCDPFASSNCDDSEMPIYMNQLILRSQIGSGFHAKFTVIGRGQKPYGRNEAIDDSVWYEFDALITNVAMSFATGQTLKSTINFITTGEIRLRVRSVTNYILQEQDFEDRIELEDYQDGLLELEQQEI